MLIDKEEASASSFLLLCPERKYLPLAGRNIYVADGNLLPVALKNTIKEMLIYWSAARNQLAITNRGFTIACKSIT